MGRLMRTCANYSEVRTEEEKKKKISQLHFWLLLEGSLGDGLESLLDIDVLLSRGLKVGDVSLWLAPGEGTLLENLEIMNNRVSNRGKSNALWGV